MAGLEPATPGVHGDNQTTPARCDLLRRSCVRPSGLIGWSDNRRPPARRENPISLSFVRPPLRRPIRRSLRNGHVFAVRAVLYPFELHPHLSGVTGLEPATSRLTADNQTTPARSRNAGHVGGLRRLVIWRMITEGLRPGVGSVNSAYCTNLQEGKYKIFPKRRSPSADDRGGASEGACSRRYAMADLCHARLPCPDPGQPRIVTPELASGIFAGFRRHDRYVCRQMAHGFLLKEKGRTCISKRLFPSRPQTAGPAA